jgi:hypothetical protein
MKKKENSPQTTPLTPDSHERLIAYTTAAGLGAFFAGQSVEAQVTESAAFAPYPATLIPGQGTGAYGIYHYFSVDGGSTPDFNFTITFPPPTGPKKPFTDQVDLFGMSTTNLALTPVPANPYLVPFLGGTTIDATTGAAATYAPRLADSYLYTISGVYYNALDSKYITTGALGFQFVGSVDGKTHFGYMDVQINPTTNALGLLIIKSVVIQGVYYNATPNAGITVPIQVNISSINVGAGNAVTINFTSNDNAPASAFTLQTSPTLGASASWTTDTSATISLITGANPAGGINQASYQAVTTATGGTSQFYRLVNSN